MFSINKNSCTSNYIIWIIHNLTCHKKHDENLLKIQIVSTPLFGLGLGGQKCSKMCSGSFNENLIKYQSQVFMFSVQF